ncbi:glycoside hydrolase, partial [bacterium]|nr:glycoside hydrolase [bacterium]
MTKAARISLSHPALLFLSLFLSVFAPAGACLAATDTDAAFAWPSTTRQCRPWTYWWWMGSAVNKEDITGQLEAFSRCGLGGVHIIPIYGAAGFEKQYLDYLSPGWMAMLRHTLAEARRLDLGVDMTLGTGWPFGGGWVDSSASAARVLFATWSLEGGQSLKGRVIPESGSPGAPLQTLMAFSRTGDRLDLTGRVDAAGILDWVAPTGDWKLYAAFLDRPVMQVKRAAPGDEGNVIDYFSRAALERYLTRFDSAFADVPRDSTVRAFYHDSYENESADWTPVLFEQFSERRGYDLRRHLPELLGEGADRETVARVRFDYRQTVADLILDGFTRPWVAWSHAHG